MNTTKTTAEIVAALLEHFPAEEIHQRPDGYDYIDQAAIMHRLIECTDGVFDIEITDGPKLVTYPKPKTGESVAIWQANVKLTIPGLGSRTNVGTATCVNEDSAKSAVTDGIKKAATLFGVALHLYAKAERAQVSNQGQRGQGNRPQAARPAGQTPAGGILAGTINDGGQCPSCHCPNGKYHTPKCQARAQRAA